MSRPVDLVEARAEAALEAQAEADAVAYDEYVHDLIGDNGWLGDDTKVLSFAEWLMVRRANKAPVSDEAVVADEDIPF